jgi:uncharacterized protein
MSEPTASPIQEQEVLTAESRFHFACHVDLPCFTRCCRDVNIYLTPYDLLRLRRTLGMGSEEFLEKYTHLLLVKGTYIPVVQLAMEEWSLACKLVGDAGCRVYGDRPWACRLYPLDLGDKEGEYRFMVGRDRCFGLGEKRTWTVQQWLDDQGVAPYAEMEKAFHQMMPPGFQHCQRMDAGLGRVMYLAYDLDRFARMVEDPHFRELSQVDDELLQRLQSDDETLLLYAFRYIRGQLDEYLQLV